MSRHEGGRGAHRGRGRGRGHDDYDYDDRPQSYQSQPYGQSQDYGYAPPSGPPSSGRGYDDYGQDRPDQGRGYAPPSGPPPLGRGGSTAFSTQGGLDRGDFASDADIDRMVAAGEFDQRREYGGRQGQGQAHGYGYGRGAGGGVAEEHGRYNAPSGPPPGQRYGERDDDRGRYDPPSGPPPGRGYQSQQSSGQGYGERDNDRGRYDTSSGPPSGRGYQSQQSSGQGYGERDNDRGRYDTSSGPPSGRGYQGQQSLGQGYGERDDDRGRYDTQSGPPSGRGYQGQQSSDQGYGSGYGGGSDRSSQYGAPQAQGRGQYDSTQGPPSGKGKSQGNAPSGGFSASRGTEDKYGSGYGGSGNDRNEPPRRGEAESYYNQGSSGQGDRYGHLAGLAQKHGDDDPDVYRRATQGLHEKIQQGRPQRRDEEDDDYKAHVDAHRKAYGDDDDGPMDANAIGAAAAMEAIKQTAAAGKSSNAPAGAFQTGKGGGGPSSKPGPATQEDDEEEGDGPAQRGGGGMQDKLMALAMSHAGKLFDKKNAGSGGGDKSQDKAEAMQSAAATAMQLFAKYQTKGGLDSGDMSSVMGLAMKML